MKKKLAIILLTIFAASILSITAGAFASNTQNTNSSNNTCNNNALFSPAPIFTWIKALNDSRNTSLQQEYVRMVGSITTFGSSNATGTLTAQTQGLSINNTDEQWSSSTAIWTTNGSVPTASVRESENFTYTYYTARLTNASYAALDYNGNDFYLNGTWNVWNVTNVHTVITDADGNIVSINNDQTLVPLATNTIGTLTVTGGWENFTLSITGVDTISGTVTFDRIIQTKKMICPFALNPNVQDGTLTNATVTPSELKSILSDFHSIFGQVRYDQSLDFAQHGRIDICDLAICSCKLRRFLVRISSSLFLFKKFSVQKVLCSILQG